MTSQEFLLPALRVGQVPPPGARVAVAGTMPSRRLLRGAHQRRGPDSLVLSNKLDVLTGLAANSGLCRLRIDGVRR
jgi:hypothetical protein